MPRIEHVVRSGTIFDETVAADAVVYSEEFAAGAETETLIAVNNQSAEDITATLKGRIESGPEMDISLILNGVQVTGFTVPAGEGRAITMNDPWGTIRVQIEGDSGATETGDVTVQWSAR